MARDEQADAILADLDRFIEQTVQAIAIEATANLQEATPVDTSWAASNWIPSVGSPNGSVDGARIPSERKDGVVTKQGSHTGGAAQQAGIAAVAHYKLGNGSAFIANHVSYIQRLNDGSSAQAPSNFVRTSIEQALATAARQMASSQTASNFAGRFAASQKAA